MLIDAIAEMRLLATLKADSDAALQAALEELSRVKQERDQAQLAFRALSAQNAEFNSARCREVAVRVLRDADCRVADEMAKRVLMRLAFQYRTGALEVPGE